MIYVRMTVVWQKQLLDDRYNQEIGNVTCVPRVGDEFQMPSVDNSVLQIGTVKKVSWHGPYAAVLDVELRLEKL